MFTNVLLALQSVPAARPLPAPICTLYDSLANALSVPIGLALGLLAFVPWVIVIGLFIALAVAHKTHVSNNVVRWLIRIIVIAIILGLLTSGSIVGTIVNSSC
jgi:hypothetical protein